MVLTLIVGLVVLGTIVVIGIIGYWIDETEQVLEDDDDQWFCPAF